MAHRTTVLLDEEARQAARQLAATCGCSLSEAVRRAVVRQRDAVVGVPRERREERVRNLERLIELFEGHDAAEEVRRLKAEDAGSEVAAARRRRRRSIG